MAPMNRNRNRDHKKTVRRPAKNSKNHKYVGGTNETRIRKKFTGHKLEASAGRNRNVKSRKMGAAIYSKARKDAGRRSFDSGELRTKKYLRKALELGLSTGYLTPDDDAEPQLLRVSSEIVRFGRCVEDDTGTEGNPRGGPAGGQGQTGTGNNSSKAGGKRLMTKDGRTNLRKRGRSRTKSPRRSNAQKRRKKRSESREKTKARVEKRKKIADGKKDETRKGKKGDDAKNDSDDDDDEPDTGNHPDENFNDGNEKVAVTERLATTATRSDKNSSANGRKKRDDENKGGSEEERSSEDGEEQDDDCDDDKEQPEEAMADEDPPNDDNEDEKTVD